MKNRAWFVNMLVAGASALAAATLASPAQAQQIRSANGTLYWNKDPGPIDPGPYWTSGQYKYDPNGYMERVARDPDQFHEMTVYADHTGRENCVFRRRVVVTTWDFQHPYLRVCRRPQKD